LNFQALILKIILFLIKTRKTVFCSKIKAKNALFIGMRGEAPIQFTRAQGGAPQYPSRKKSFPKNKTAPHHSEGGRYIKAFFAYQFNYFLVESAAALATESTVAFAESAVAEIVESVAVFAESIAEVAALAVESAFSAEPLPPQEATNTPKARAKKPIFRAFFMFCYF
jgi:hypothetical protein